MKTCRCIGLMSGTSLDGIDVAACEFFPDDGKWSFIIHAAVTCHYSDDWVHKLSMLPHSDALTLARVHVEYGHLLGRTVKEFIGKTGFSAELVASHGHTIFHQPAAGLTLQIGDGSAIAAETGLPVVCDFRSADVALGGQGAPLVPAGDRILFGEYDACLNLGGFANISMEKGGDRIAFDISPVNIVLNRLAATKGLAYDPEGKMASSGKSDPVLLEKLNNLHFYSAPPPKSLGREWLEKEFLPLLDIPGPSLEDKMRTVCDHVACQVHKAINGLQGNKILVTGGGAWNSFLMQTIREQGSKEFIIPDQVLVDYKEALVFAFLGVLRWRGDINVLGSVTGSRLDHSGGAVWHPIPLLPPPGGANP